MGIFEAERRGHTGEEDMLTSSVFGTLEILDRSKFLKPVLEQCGVELKEEIDPSLFTFSYWESTGKRTPDVVLRDKSVLISIENKLGSPADANQLVEEYEDGMKPHKNFWLIAVTADYVQPPQIEEAEKTLMKKGQQEPRIQWCNWQQIYAMLRRNSKRGNETEQKLVDGLLSLLEAKGLSMFEEFNEAQLNSVAQLWPEVIDLLHKCSALFGTLSSRLHEKDITCIEKGFPQETVLTGTRGRMALQDFGRWLPGGIGMRAWDNGWKERDPRQGFLLRIGVSPSSLEVGYRFGFGKNVEWLRMFGETAQMCHLAEKLRTVNTCVVSYYGGGYKLLDRLTGDSLSEEAFSLEALGNTRFLIIGRVFDHKAMASPRLVDEIVECLVQIREIINQNGLYFSKQAIESFARYDTEEEMEGLPIEGQPDEQESEEG